MTKKIQLISPMWPSDRDVFIGIFVQNVVRALEDLGFVVDTHAVIRGRSRSTGEKLRSHAKLGLSILGATSDEADLVYLHLNEIKRSGPVAEEDELVEHIRAVTEVRKKTVQLQTALQQLKADDSAANERAVEEARRELEAAKDAASRYT